MVRKYKFHKTYAVIYYDRSFERYFYIVFLTKRGAKEYVEMLGRSETDITRIEIVKRVWAYDHQDGRVPLETL